MDTVIVKPRSKDEYTEVISLLRKMKIKTEIYKARSKDEILKSIKSGANEAGVFLKGKVQLQDAKSLLREL